MISIEEIERIIRMCTLVDPDTLSVVGAHKAAEGIIKEIARKEVMNQREEFEKWAINKEMELELEWNETTYWYCETELFWECWQAAQKAAQQFTRR